MTAHGIPTVPRRVLSHEESLGGPMHRTICLLVGAFAVALTPLLAQDIIEEITRVLAPDTILAIDTPEFMSASEADEGELILVEN